MTIYNWAKGKISNPEIPGSVPQVMSPKWYGDGGVLIADAQTGEKFGDIVAYDSRRKLVDRPVLDANGKMMLNAAGDALAVTTEFRELVISPPPEDT